MALPVNVHLLLVKGFEILLFQDSKVRTRASLPVPTQHQETEARSSKSTNTASLLYSYFSLS